MLVRMARKAAERAEALVERWGAQVDDSDASGGARGGDGGDGGGGGDGSIEVEIDDATQAVTMEVMHEAGGY